MKIFKEWFSTHRFVYNRAVAYSKNPTSSIDLDTLFNKNHTLNFFTMRNIFVTEKGSETSLNDWEFNTPKDVRAGAIKEFTTQLKTNIQKVKKKTILSFNMNFKSRKRKTTECVALPKSCIKFKDGKVSIYSTFVKEKIKLGKRHGKRYPKPTEVETDVKLMYDGRDFFLLIPRKINVKDKGEDEKKIVALDPGVRVFQTGFSESECFEANVNTEKMRRFKLKISLLQSIFMKKEKRGKQESKTNCKNHKTKRKLFNLNKKIKDMIAECHWQTANYLVKNYNDVLLPSFESQDMVKGSSLSKKTKNEMLCLSHYAFKIRLQEKSKEYKHVRIHDVNESYTSKTCTHCGCINDVGSSKVYSCKSCSLVIDRDVNGARNIFIKHACLS